MNRFTYLAIFLIIVLAAFLRLWDLRDTPLGLYHDEAMNVNQAREAWREGDFKIFYPENNGREGLFINIQALSMATFGYSPFAARLPSALFGISTVLGVFFLTKALFDINPKHEARNSKQYINPNDQNKKQFRISDFGFRISRGELLGLLSSFFLAASFWHINFSRIGFRAIIAPFFLVWSMYFLWTSLRRASANERRGDPADANGIASSATPPRNDTIRSTLNAAIGGLLFGLGFHSYIAYRVAPFLLIIPFFVAIKNNKLKACAPCLLALFLFFAFIAALPIGVYFLGHPADFAGRSAQVSIFSSATPLHDLGKNILATAGMFFWRGDYNWRHNFSGSPQLWWPISILFLIGFLMYSRSLLKNIVSPEGFLFSWMLIFLLPVTLSNEGLPHALRALPLVIPAVIFAAVGLEWVVKKTNQWIERRKEKFPDAEHQLTRIKKELILLLLICFAAVAMHDFNQYFLRWSWNPNVYDAFNGRYADLGRSLAILPDATKKYVIVNTPGHMLVDTIPMPAQTVMFFTDTWNKQKRDEKNFLYIPLLRPAERGFEGQVSLFSRLPENIDKPTIIAMLENDPALRRELKARYPELTSNITEGGQILTNIK